METVAMYWEPRIKTYGFQVTRYLALYRYAFSADLSAQWNRAAAGIADNVDRFHLVTAQPGSRGELDLLLVCEPGLPETAADPLSIEMPAAADHRVESITPVAMLCFQGPHYGDRFGIADFTYRSLEKYARHLHAAVFSCASVYLVFPEDRIAEARSRLEAAFRIPR